MDASSLVEQGIAAYRSGNKEEAVRLLGQALRENRQNEEAWLYLGAALDDPAKKRQAFEQVLQINPDNDKAKNALARLDAAAGVTPPSPAAPTVPMGGSAGPSAPPPFTNTDAPRPKPKNTYAGSGQGFALPFNVEGQPSTVTLPYLIDNGRARIQQAIQIYINRDFEQIVNAGRAATMWDAVFTAGVGVVAIGAATFVGSLIGWPLSGFAGSIGGLIYPFIAAIIVMLATAAGFAVAVYASQWYLQNQKINVPLPQHAMYVTLTFLPLVLVNAVTTFFSHLLVGILAFLALCLSPILLIIGLAAFFYGIYILWQSFERVYGAPGSNRGMITAGFAAGGWIVASAITQFLLGAIFIGLLSAIFRYRFV
ncbi:MAG: hypothetical protein IT324_33905 [Anaerolineae bacterium]|nr:hypothetical protein [Anaerolineae bacterium]